MCCASEVTGAIMLEDSLHLLHGLWGVSHLLYDPSAVAAVLRNIGLQILDSPARVLRKKGHGVEGQGEAVEGEGSGGARRGSGRARRGQWEGEERAVGGQ